MLPPQRYTKHKQKNDIVGSLTQLRKYMIFYEIDEFENRHIYNS